MFFTGCQSGAPRTEPELRARGPLDLGGGDLRSSELPPAEASPAAPPADATPLPATPAEQTEEVFALRSAAAPAAAPLELFALRSRFGPRLQVLPDGRIRRMLHVPFGAAAPLRELLVSRWLPELFAADNPEGNEVAIESGADVTLTTALNPLASTAVKNAPLFTTNQVWNKVPVADWLIVTGDEETQVEVDQWLSAWWTGRDHIEVRVVVIEREISDADDFGSITEILPNSVDATFQGLLSEFPNSVSGGGVFRFQDADDFASTLQWISRRGEASIRSVPSIVMRDHGSARISAVTRTPYLQVDRLDATGQASTFKVAFADTGVTMKVAASVVGLDRIFLELEIAVTSLNTALTNPAIPAPALSETSLPVPRVTIADGQTLWIGGLQSEFEREIERKFPILGDIPLLGYFFKSMLSEKRKTEVLFALTPTIRHYGGALPEVEQTGDAPLQQLFDAMNGDEPR
ncbi:MAG: type II and III secretion system protein [Planctomycetes bacterium]|nr:type II and III secretion system protein [Planctomycetota bacterium]